MLDLNNTTQTIKSLSGGGTNGGNVAIGSGSLTINGTGTTTFSGLFTGSGALSVTNAGKLTLRGDSTWTGPLNVSGGAVVSIDSAARLGPSGTANGQITLDNGTIEQTNPGTNGTFTPALRNITLGAGGGTLSYTTAGSQSIVQTGTVISGSGGLTKDGAGIIAVVTPATYTGPTHVVAGTLRVRTNNNVFPIATALTVDAGATFDLDVKSQEVGSLSGAGVVHINGATGSAQTFTVGNLGTSTTFSGSFTEGTITGGRVTKVGGGTLTLSGTSSYTGATTISGGILATNLLANGGTASGIGQSTSAAGNLVLDGGRLRYTGPAVSTDRLFTLNSTGGIIDARGTGPLMFTSTGTVGGPGTGTLTLTGTNTGAQHPQPRPQRFEYRGDQIGGRHLGPDRSEFLRRRHDDYQRHLEHQPDVNWRESERHRCIE